MLNVLDNVNSVGVRLKNPRFYCFLNTAVNAVVTNEKLLEQILNDNTVKIWGENVLAEHDSNFVGGIERSYEDVLHCLRVFITNPVGCIDSHNENCFSAIKKEISSKLLQQKIVEELKRILFSEDSVRDAHLLRQSLTDVFPVFKDDVQHDAADAYLSLLQCIPNTENLCSLKLRRYRSCVECPRVNVLEVNEEWCIMLKRDDTKVKSLQYAINEWCEEESTIFYNCECKLQNGVRNSNDPPEMYYT